MRPTKNELILRKTTKFTKADLNSSSVLAEVSGNSDSIGGVIRKGQLGWLARGPLLEVFSLRNGNKISSYRFDVATNFQRCFITCVSEIEAPNLNYFLLAVGVQFGDDPGGMVSIYSVQESKVLRSIETAEKVTCCHLIDSNVAERTVLEVFQGCLAIGTDVGKIILMDLYLRKCEQTLVEMKTSDDDFFLVPCHVVLSSMDAAHIRKHFRHSRQDNIGFGIQMEIVENASLVLSIESLGPLLALAVGLEDGRMILYSLSDLQPFHLAYPPEEEAPLVKLSYVEPPDDPRACIYIWAFHESPNSSVAVMHSVMCDRKTTDDDEDDGFCIFEGFQSCSVRLTLPMFERGSIPVSCQSVTISPSQDNEETISLCLLSWKSKKGSEILIFDINQWYKEQMPNVGDWRDNLSYLASFPLRENDLLDVWLDGRTVAPFNSIQRPEEHFFPISLSFDCVSFRDKEGIKYHWPGLQNRVLSMLNIAGPPALLEPSLYYYEIAKASLVPLNSPDYNFNSNLSVNAQREIILSVALEYSCFGLLKECAKCWADGSHLGRNPEESLSLSTLTTWIWKRAENIKDRCNILCVPLFDHSGLRMDQRSQIELSYCSRQLKLLADLMSIILTKCSAYIPEEVNTTLTTQYNSIKMVSEYQEVLQWFLNVGLLPEAPSDYARVNTYLDNTFDSRTPLVPYPHRALRNFYMSRRLEFKKINSGLLSPRTQSCRILYIDSFIEHECNANVLRDHWLESGGNGLYPPSSLQAMLRTLLVPDVPIENKYVLFIYFFHDLNMTLGVDERYGEVIENCMKFPSVFKISSSTIKTVQAFWHLDHGNFEASLENIISPFLHDHKLIQWQKELLIEALLVPRAWKLALRALQTPGPPISSLLELKTLLANDMVAEAFHLQRTRHDRDLFKEFLNGCLYHGKLGDLLDLALNEDEDRLLEQYLRKTKSAKTENLHFVHLLQRSKYVEAIQQLDELSRSKYSQDSVDLETPNLVLAAYNTTMTPATKHLSEVYYGIRNRLSAREPEAQKLDTLSSQLLRRNANDLLGGVYQSSLLSVDEATNYWEEDVQRGRKRLLCPSNVPFIRRPQLEAYFGPHGENTLCYPELYRGAQKRRLDISSETEKESEHDIIENPKKRQKINDSLSGMKTAEPLNATLLTRFKNRHPNKSPTRQQTSMTNITQSRFDRECSIVSLNMPIVKTSRTALESRDESMSDTSEVSRVYRVGTPHSILKVRTANSASVSSPLEKAAESTPRRSMSPKEMDQNEYIDEEKSIRFDLPSANATVNSSLQITHESMDSSSRESPESIVAVGVETEQKDQSRRFSGPSARKSLRSIDTSLVSASGDEEFFSPLQSRDNSIQKTDKEESEPEDDKKSDKVDSDPNYLRPTGPMARRPLDRSSRSRSKTPEIPASPTRKSSRLQDKTITKSVEVCESQSPTETVKQTTTTSKSLSRLVIESEAKKVHTLTSVESTLFEKGRVFAHSTKLHVTATISDIPIKEPRKFSELSTMLGSTLHVPSSLHMTSTPESTADTILVEGNDDADNHLNTTVGMSGFDITVDEVSPPEKDTSRALDTIGGRKTYKLNKNPLFESTQLVETKHESLSKDECENASVSKIESNQQGIMVDEDVESVADSEESAVEAKQSQETTKHPDSDVEEEAMELSDHDTEDEETVEEEEYEQVVIDDDEDESEDAESEDSESKVGDVISISSGNESSSQTTEVTTSESRSSTDSSKNSGESAQSIEDQDDEKLLYGDLEIEQSVHSSNSADTENFNRPPSINEIEISFAPREVDSPNAIDITESQEAPIQTNAVFTSTTTSMMYSDLGVSSARPSGITLNILTGDYENIDEDEDMEKDFDATKGRLEATSTTLTDVTRETVSIDEDASSKNVASEQSSSLSNQPLGEVHAVSIVETSEKADEVSCSKDLVNSPSPSTSFSTENTTYLIEVDNNGESAPVPQSEPEDQKETTDIGVNHIRIEASGDKASHDNSQPTEENIEKTPVKSLLEVDSITDSGRVLRSTRRRSTSIDTTKTEIELSFVDSPSITKRSLRASSVPHTESAETPTKTQLRRRSNSTDNPATPTRILTRRRSTLLDKIEEDTILDSPRRSTRKRIEAEGEIEDAKTPSSTMKRARRTSTSSLDTPVLPSTPRSTSRRGMVSEDNVQTPQRSRRLSTSKDTPKAEPKSETKEKGAKRYIKKPNTPEVGKPDHKSDKDEILEGEIDDLTEVKGSGVRKLFTKMPVEKSDVEQHSPESESYEKSRRLTRHQQSVLEKSVEIAKKVAETVPKKVTRRRVSKLEESSPNKKDDASETESIVSAKSNRSTVSAENRRVTRRSLALKVDEEEDILSISSSTGSKRSTKSKKPTTSSIDKTLGAIAEEDQENVKKTDSNQESDGDDRKSTYSATSRGSAKKKLGRTRKTQK